jgi:uncharacterized HhH-GPD family protein
MGDAAFYLTGDPAADDLLDSDPNALLIGMLLDQQVPMEKAFSGPKVIAERMGGTLDVAAIATADPEEFAKLCATPPAVHRFPGSMAGRIQALCRSLQENWEGSAANLYAAATTGAQLHKLLAALPGFGAQKAAIFLAMLGKRRGITPVGWREASAPFGEDSTHLSVADIVDPESLQLVRAAKRAAKQAAKSSI